MNINEFNEIYLLYLKRKPTISDINAHIKKDKNIFIREILNCKEYANIMSIYVPNLDLINKVNTTIKFNSGYGNIFMHNSSLYYTSPNNIYEYIGLSSPSYYENKWHSILAITTNDQRVITNSNTFYWENWQTLGEKWTIQNDHNKIYDRIVYTYHHIKNTPLKNRTYIDTECFLMANPYTGVNSGHELSIILDCVDYIRKANIQKIVIFNYSYKYPNNLYLLKLLVPEDNLLFINFNTVYQFRKIHIIKQELHNICKHQYLIEELKHKILAKGGDVTKYKNKKIIMIKNIRNIQVLRSYDQFICERLFSELHKRGYVIINPEQMDIFDLALYLMHARIIISSYGGILYTNQIFFNMGADIYIMCTSGTVITSYYRIISRTKEIIPLPDKNLDARNDLTSYLLSKFT
jgi:mRNA-degrading endonuclease HigB of HigAB toxin-antitoxin module